MKQIVVATDASTAARSAVDVGIALAGSVGAAVRLVHVLAPPDWEERGTPRRSLSPEEEHAIHRAEAHAAERGVALEVELLPLEGSAAETIAGHAGRLDADVIVVGSRGRSGLGVAVLGSVAQGVVHNSRRPVLVVPAGATMG
ncbi:MAG: universal stress protein [Actinobacteria bacterium]|nr:universal stress protein [Actinomycetota bacterium]